MSANHGCPHTTRLNADPAWCSQCLGIKTKRSVHVFCADGLQLDLDVIDRVVDASKHGTRAPRARAPRKRAQS